MSRIECQHTVSAQYVLTSIIVSIGRYLSRKAGKRPLSGHLKSLFRCQWILPQTVGKERMKRSEEWGLWSKTWI